MNIRTSSLNHTTKHKMLHDIAPPPKICRQYSEACDIDRYNILHGRCPDYALHWGLTANLPHWPENHNFLYGTNPHFRTTRLAERLRRILNDRLIQNDYRPILFIGCDINPSPFQQWNPVSLKEMSQEEKLQYIVSNSVLIDRGPNTKYLGLYLDADVLSTTELADAVSAHMK